MVYLPLYRDDSGGLKITEILSLRSDSLRLYSLQLQFRIKQIFSKPTIQNVGSSSYFIIQLSVVTDVNLGRPSI